MQFIRILGKIAFLQRLEEIPAFCFAPEKSLGHLKFCGTVNKEKGFAKSVLKNACKNIPVNKL